jgi:quercetin dioxygenase-like cupin family protein
MREGDGSMRCLTTFLAGAALFCSASGIDAQDVGIKTTQFTKQDVTGAPGREVTFQSLDMAPGSSTDLQTHPGDEIGAVIEGTVLVGHGDEDLKEVLAGQAFTAPPNSPLRIKNAGDKPAKVVTVQILEKGKPSTTVLPPGK